MDKKPATLVFTIGNITCLTRVRYSGYIAGTVLIKNPKQNDRIQRFVRSICSPILTKELL